MHKSWLLLLLLIVASTVPAAVYKWVDQTGEVHYSDQRVPGAEPVELRNSSIYSPTKTPKEVDWREAAGVTARPGSYDSLAITSPAQEQTIHSNEQQVNVAISVQPPLTEGDSFRLFLDGTAVSGNLATPLITLQNVERGTHTLSAAVVDQAGKERIRSETVTFYLRKISVLTLPGRPTPLPEEPGSGDDDGSEPPDEENGDEADGEDGNDSGNIVGPGPVAPGDNPYAPNFRPNYRPAPSGAP